MPFVKLDCGMLLSTIWFDFDARTIFITALLMAEPAEYPEPVPQIEVGSLNETGWSAPPGWYGYVPAAGPGIVHASGVSEVAGMAALARLGEPDLGSRSQQFEGRRLIRIDGGYLVLNYIRYRDKDATSADRSKRWRDRQKVLALENVATRVADTPTRVIRHQAEAEAEAEAPPLRSGKSKSKTLSLPDWLDHEAWKAWETYKREKKQKLPPSTVKSQLAQLEKWKAAGQDPAAILQRSIANGWTGLFELPEPSKGGSSSTASPRSAAPPPEERGRTKAEHHVWAKHGGPFETCTDGACKPFPKRPTL